MKLVVGLGNPGKSYEKNYHNAGFLVLDSFLARYNLTLQKQKFNGTYLKARLGGVDVIFAKPFTFMNLSGNFVLAIASYFNIPPEDVLIIHDDKDIMLNKFKYKVNGGAGGQNGVANIIQTLNSKSFSRLRIGIGTPHIKSIKNHVLSNFTSSQLKALEQNENLLDSIEAWIIEGIQQAMNDYNEK